MKIFHQNVCVLLRVLDHIKILLHEVKGIDVFGISKSHLNSKIDDKELKITGYKLHRFDRKNGPGGGAAVYIGDHLNFDKRPDLEVDGIECCWIEIFVKKSKSLLVGVLYRPPDSSSYLSENFELLLDEMLSTAVAEEKETILMGDINCDFLKRNDHRNVKNTFSSYGFKQKIKDPTRITPQTSTLIDIIATTHPENVKSSIVLGSPLSDHEFVAIIRKINCQRAKLRKGLSRNFSKYYHEAFQKELASVSWDDILKQTNVNDA